MRSYAGAVTYANGQHLHPDYYVRRGGRCQQFARSCVGASGWANSAIQAWHAIPTRHRHTGVPRPGSIAYYDRPDIPDSREFGHAVFVVENGYVWSTDILRYGHVDRVPYTAFKAKWGMRYLGWIDWTPSGAINLKPTAPPVPKPPAFNKPIGWNSTDRAQILAVQKCLNRAGYKVSMTGTYIQGKDGAMRMAIGSDDLPGSYAANHLKAYYADGDKPGVVGPNLYRSLMTFWY